MKNGGSFNSYVSLPEGNWKKQENPCFFVNMNKASTLQKKNSKTLKGNCKNQKIPGKSPLKQLQNGDIKPTKGYIMGNIAGTKNEI